MALILIEEVLIGVEEAKDALAQAVMTLDMIVEDLHPRLGNDLKAVLERDFLAPLKIRLEAMEQLLDEVAATADQ
jgi:hypothetical protein